LIVADPSDGAEILGSFLAVLRALHNVERNLLAFVQIVHPCPFDSADVDEYVLAAVVGLNEAITLLRIKPLNRSGAHREPFLRACDQIGSACAPPVFHRCFGEGRQQHVDGATPGQSFRPKLDVRQVGINLALIKTLGCFYLNCARSAKQFANEKSSFMPHCETPGRWLLSLRSPIDQHFCTCFGLLQPGKATAIGDHFESCSRNVCRDLFAKFERRYPIVAANNNHGRAVDRTKSRPRVEPRDQSLRQQREILCAGLQ
jgi:hypothetical protein